jgi:hypothetical protein
MSDGMTLFVTIPGTTRESQEISLFGLCFRISADLAALIAEASQLARALLCMAVVTAGVEDWLTSETFENPDGEFRSSESSDFDTRLYSGTGSGHIRRPAALDLLLRCAAPCGFRFLPKQTHSNGKERRANFFWSLWKSRPSALGSRAHSRGFAMCAPSKSGIQNGEKEHEQNHANRISRK